MSEAGEDRGLVTVVTGDGSRHDVTTKALTIICHQGDVDIREVVPADGGAPIVEIGPDHTLHAISTMSAETYRFWCSIEWLVKAWHEVVGSEGKHTVVLPEDINAMRKASLAFRHVFGLLTRLAEVVVSDSRPHIRYPESYLHPSQQVAIANVLLRLVKGRTDAKA